MKTLKTLILIILIAAIGICGYLCYQEYFQKETPVEQDYEPSVTILNDSTYHINLSESLCCTLMKSGDVLFVETVGADLVMASHEHDSINLAVIKTYTMDYTDYFGPIRFDSIDLKCR